MLTLLVVEAGIPEDDARNPATIADNVGDNVGDVAGMGADLYESYYGSIRPRSHWCRCGVHPVARHAWSRRPLAFALAVAPLALAGVGIFCSIAGIFTVKAEENASFAKLLRVCTRAYVASFLVAVAAFGVLSALWVGQPPRHWPAWARAGGSLVSRS